MRMNRTPDLGRALPTVRIVVGGIAVLVALWAVLIPQTVAGQAGATAPAHAQLIADLVDANHILATESILDGLGHVSVRDDRRTDRFILSGDAAPGMVTSEVLMEYDIEGRPVNARGRRSYQERFIHAAIYKARPDVNSVIHAHTPSVLPFADSSVPLVAMYHMSSFLGDGGAPVFEIRDVEGSTGMLVNDMVLGAALAETLGDGAVALMRGHGLVVVGPSVTGAVSRSIFLDVNARVQAQTIALGGTVTPLAGADFMRPRPTVNRQPASSPYPRSWPFWKQRAAVAMGK